MWLDKSVMKFLRDQGTNPRVVEEIEVRMAKVTPGFFSTCGNLDAGNNLRRKYWVGFIKTAPGSLWESGAKEPLL